MSSKEESSFGELLTKYFKILDNKKMKGRMYRPNACGNLEEICQEIYERLPDILWAEEGCLTSDENIVEYITIQCILKIIYNDLSVFSAERSFFYAKTEH
ncbi:MAG: hypothetical protein WCX74_00540 [Candidatus Paceibacterota bacterium]